MGSGWGLLRAGAGVAGLLLAGSPAGAARVTLSDAAIRAGESFQIGGSLFSDPGDAVAALSVDIGFDEAFFSTAPDCRIAPRIGAGSTAEKTLVQSLKAPGVLRVGILSVTNNNAISDGDLFSCTMESEPAAPSGDYILTSSAGASRPDGSSLPITGGFATVAVSGSAVGACNDGIDNDGDGRIDYPDDGGCVSAADLSEVPEADADGDGVDDARDNCTLVANPGQEDVDAGQDDDSSLPGIQHYGDACDADLDNDGVVGATEFFGVLRPCIGQVVAENPSCARADLDGDGIVGATDFFGMLRPRMGTTPGPGVTESP